MAINEIENLKHLAYKLSTTHCIVNGEIWELNKIEQLGCNKFSLQSKLTLPLKLYKYFPNICNVENINYSIESLKNNTVYLQTPNNFDDVYDSDIHMDYSEYERYRLIEYCERSDIQIDENLSTHEIGDLFVQSLLKIYLETKDFSNIFTKDNLTEIEKLSNKLFVHKIIRQLEKSDDLTKAVQAAIQSDFEEYSFQLKNTFRVSCFTTNPYSQLMWAGYANCHKGFCVEYTILPNDKKYEKIYINLFPMIYCKTRPNMTKQLSSFEDKDITEDIVWNIYFHGALRKSLDWAYQNEWRLLMPRGNKVDDFNKEFFPITKVFLGNKMDFKTRKEIIEICNSKNIPYIGVTRKLDTFEMEECKIKCEDCYKFKR